MAYALNEVLFGHQKGVRENESQKYHAEQKKPDLKGYVLYVPV